MKISILGCGWLGTALGKNLISQGHEVWGTCRTKDKALHLENLAINPLIVTFDPEPSCDLSDFLVTDYLIIALPPRASQYAEGHHAAQILGIIKALGLQKKCPQIIYISSTSVYPENNKTIDERAETIGDSVLVIAENLLKEYAPQTIVLRCGGLMGGNRIPGKYFIGKTVDTGQVPVNFVHQGDVVQLIGACITQQTQGEIFNVVAPEHPVRQAIYQKNALQFGWLCPTFINPPQPIAYKIVNSDKIINYLNYTFLFPNPLDFDYD